MDESIVFDIKILDKDGQELQPDTSKGEVKVNFESLDLSALKENKELAVYHMEDADSEAKKIEDIKLDAKGASLEVAAPAEEAALVEVVPVPAAEAALVPVAVRLLKEQEITIKISKRPTHLHLLLGYRTQEVGG